MLNMNPKILEKWMAEGQVTLPQVLVKNYATIGLNEIELVLLLQFNPLPQRQNFSRRWKC